MVLFYIQNIRQSYDRDPNLYSVDVDLLHHLRQSAMTAVMSSASTVEDCTALKRYYVQLVRLTEKFPGLLQQQSVDTNETCDNTDVNPERSAISLTFMWWVIKNSFFLVLKCTSIIVRYFLIIK